MMSRFCVFILLSFLLLRCSVENDDEIIDPDATVSMQSLKPVLKGFNINGRQYDLFYNGSDEIDSIVVSEGNWILYSYKVKYENELISEVNLWDNGEIVATNDEFAFDKKGNITSYVYTFYLPDMEEGIETTINASYDQRGRVTSLFGTLAYDQHSNVIEWIQGSYMYQYNYDKMKNPLYTVKNLFVILVEETGYWDYIFSKYNSLSKTRSDGSTIEFINGYDARRRLASKTAYLEGVLQEKIVFNY